MTFGEDWGAAKDEATKSMRPIAKPAESCAAWLRHRPGPVLPVLGARKVSHLQDNLTSLDFNLSVEQVEALDEASSIEPVQLATTQ
jgi:aryl-alcohol dehydrogenase-like predicted oxidoreductase